VDRDEQAADPVGQPGRLAGQVVVEPDEDFQLSEGLVAGVDPAQRVRQGPGGVGDDEGVAGVCLGVPGVDAGEPPHRQAGQVGHLAAAGAGHRDRQRPDRAFVIDAFAGLIPGWECSGSKRERPQARVRAGVITRAHGAEERPSAPSRPPLPVAGKLKPHTSHK
jgi:hypothetical protein